MPPSLGPTVASPNYVGPSNGTLPKTRTVHGKAFDRFIQVAFAQLAFIFFFFLTLVIDMAREYRLCYGKRQCKGILLNDLFNHSQMFFSGHFQEPCTGGHFA